MSKNWRATACLLGGLFAAAASRAQEIDSSMFAGLEARAIGPAVMSGRIAAIDAVATYPLTTAILSTAVLRDDRLTGRVAAGAVIIVAAIVCLIIARG